MSDHSSKEELNSPSQLNYESVHPRIIPRSYDQDSNNGQKKAAHFWLNCIIGINGIILFLAVIGIILGIYCAVELHSQKVKQNDLDLRLMHIEQKQDEMFELVSLELQ